MPSLYEKKKNGAAKSSAMLAVQSRENNLPPYCGFYFEDDAAPGPCRSSLPSYLGFDYDESDETSSQVNPLSATAVSLADPNGEMTGIS